ncbi:MAG: MerR family transcriptional regulator [Pseudomonadota bacterium]|nr:MerR family transcriptional regulator [Pseudomonadota bacterium]MBU1569857.1 MerR family transcriptional regulator [Pseudomonadota bacterium]
MQNDSQTDIKIPDKLYFKIGQVGKIAGLPTSVIRFWETEFSKINPKRSSSGQRLYRKSDVEFILRIKYLLYDKKFTIRGAKKHLRSDTGENKASSATIEELRQDLISIKKMLT